MKVTSLASLLVLGLPYGQASAASDAPSCVVTCTNTLAKQLSPVEGMRTLCDTVASQRALFQCLASSCRSRTYGPALGHVVSACSGLGIDISPLHPIEVLYATHVNRQVIPTEPGPVLPGPPTPYNTIPTQPGPVLPGPSVLCSTKTLTLNHRLDMGFECRAGADGLFTVSPNIPQSDATPPAVTTGGSLEAAGAHGLDGSVDVNNPATQTLGSPLGDSFGRNTTTICVSSAASTLMVTSNTLAPAQSIACACQGQNSSPTPSMELMSASVLQGPAEQQTTSTPSTSSLVITQLPGHTTGTQRGDCDKVETLASNNTTAPSRARLSLSPAAVTQVSSTGESSNCSAFVAGSMQTPLQTSSAPSLTFLSTFGTETTYPTSAAPLTVKGLCSNSSSVCTTTAAPADPSWGLSVAGFSSGVDGLAGLSSATRAGLITSVRETTSCSSDGRVSASFAKDLDASLTLAQASASLLQVSASLRQVAANATTTVFSRTIMPPTLVTLSTLTMAMSLPAPANTTTALPAYTVDALPEPPTNSPPLAAYDYNSPLSEYGKPSVSTPSSSSVTPSPSTPALAFGPAGVTDAGDVLTPGEAVSTLSSLYPVSYRQEPGTTSSPSRASIPVKMADNVPFVLEVVAELRGQTRHEEAKRTADWSNADKPRSTTTDDTLRFEATSTAAKNNLTVSGANMTRPLTTSGGTALVPNLTLVWTAVILALAAVGATRR